MSNKETGVEEVEFNINYYVKVKLTETGKKHLFEDWHKLMKDYPVAIQYRPPKVDADGYTRFQLWDLMSRLGEYTSMGLKQAFETNIIICIPTKIG